MKKLLFAVCSLLSLCCAALEFSSADVVIPAEASPYLKLCAAELSNHLVRLTGGRFNITSNPASEVKIYLGRRPEGVTSEDINSLAGDAFYTVVQGKDIYITGKDTMEGADPYRLCNMLCDRGTLAGVHAFLEAQGIRFLAPGDENTFVPEKSFVTVKEGKTLTRPAFIERAPNQISNFGRAFPDSKEYLAKTHDVNMWAMRNRYNTNKKVRTSHTEQFLELAKLWPDNPERFQLDKNGTRNKRYSCWTDPAVKEIWFKVVDAYFSGKTPAEIGMSHVPGWRGQYLADEFMIDPMDHGSMNDGRCRCERCNEFRSKYPCEDDTEIIWTVLADVAEKIGKKYPGKNISTLVYPPKRFMPKHVKVPANIRVRICFDGPKMVDNSEKLQADIASLNEWSTLLGRENVKVWLYQCEIFGGKLPGPMEFYPEKFSRYIRAVEPYCDGIFYEFMGLTFTYKHLEMYLHSRLMWNPSQDVNALKKEFIQLYYGPAAEPMWQIYSLFEKLWGEYWKKSEEYASTGASLGRALHGQLLRKLVWTEVYTADVMNRIDVLLKKAESAAKVKPYATRVALMRKYVFDIMKAERAKVMSISDKAPTVELSDRWTAGKLINADVTGKELKAETLFRMRRNNWRIEFEIEAFESGTPKVRANRRDGSPDLWQDSCIELFFYSPKTETLKHLFVNWQGRSTVLEISPKNSVYRKAGEFNIQLERGTGKVTFRISLPEMALDMQDLRFNLTRERHVQREKPEYPTFSEASTLGLWDNPDSFAKINLK